jgi:DNA-binding MarR family transcriptional regulator
MSQSERLIVLEIRSLMAGLARMAHRSTEEYLNRRGYAVSMLQVGVLHAISHENQTISELSRRFNLDPSTLVPTVDALERKGYVVRGRDPNDRRRVPLTITEEGSAIIAEVVFVHDDDALLEALQRLGADKTEHLLGLLRELTRLMPGGEDWLCEMQPRLEQAARTMRAQNPLSTPDSDTV